MFVAFVTLFYNSFIYAWRFPPKSFPTIRKLVYDVSAADKIITLLQHMTLNPCISQSHLIPTLSPFHFYINVYLLGTLPKLEIHGSPNPKR